MRISSRGKTARVVVAKNEEPPEFVMVPYFRNIKATDKKTPYFHDFHALIFYYELKRKRTKELPNGVKIITYSI